MKRIRVICIVSLVLSAAVLRGQEPVADPGITSSFKQETDPSSHSADIIAQIQAEVTKLANDSDTPGQTAARDWLIAEALLNNSATSTSPGYIDLYTDSLNKALIGLMQNATTTVRVRINCAIIAQRVSHNASNSNLLPVVLSALGDKSPAVVIWGEKAAAEILPPVFQNLNITSNGPKLLDAIVEAVAQHSGQDPISGDIAYEAYAALNPTARATALPTTAISSVADAVIKLQQVRIKQYENGIPPSPDADTPGSLFLLSTGPWTGLTPKQQAAAMQNAVDIVWYAAQRAAELPVNQSEELIHTLNHEGGLIQSLADTVFHDPNLSAIALQIAKLPIGSQSATVTGTCSSLYGSVVKTSDVFANLQPPKDLTPLPKVGKP